MTFSFYEYFTEVLCAAFNKILIKYTFTKKNYYYFYYYYYNHYFGCEKGLTHVLF